MCCMHGHGKPSVANLSQTTNVRYAPKPDSRSPISSAAKVPRTEAAAQLICDYVTKRRAATPEVEKLQIRAAEGHADSPFGSDHADETQPLMEKATMWVGFFVYF